MKYEEILKVLKKYNVTTIDELEYYLSVMNNDDECINDPIEHDKDCMNAKCYEDLSVPDCRKIYEIYKKYFQKDFKTKKLFIDYLEKYTFKKRANLENYLSCKSCNQQMKKLQLQKKKIDSESIAKNVMMKLEYLVKISDFDFKNDFCKNLDIKFDYNILFETEYKSIKQFLAKKHYITSDNFKPLYSGEETMTKKEEKKLFDMVHTSRGKLKINLSKKENLIGSDKYIFNLANYAFERNLLDESYLLLKQIEDTSSKYKTNKEFMQLKAKIFSSMQKDSDAIEVLEKLIEQEKPNIDVESYSLLAASIKRKAFSDYEVYGDEFDLVNKLIKAKDIYSSIYQLSQDYYPALNYIYLSFMLAYLNNESEDFFQKLKKESEEIWNKTNHQVSDWWNFISNVEFLILIKKYNEAQKELESHFDELDKEEITEFNISSSLRQLKLYQNFCNDKELQKIIEYISNI